MGLDIRPAGKTVKAEFRKDKSSAANGNALEPIKYYLGDKYKIFRDYLRNRDFTSGTKYLVSLFTGKKDPKPGEVLKLNNLGAQLFLKMLNKSSGFVAKNDAGERISAPYLKVY